jgi:hypothetical protein
LDDLKGRGHMGDLGTGGRIISNWVLKIYGVRLWTGFHWLRIHSSGGLF